MRKNINKIVAIGIGLTIMSGSIIPVFAAETTENNKNISTSILENESNSIILSNSTINGQTTSGKQIITLDKVIAATIANSDKLALKQKELQKYEKEIDLQDEKDDFYKDNNLKTNNDTIDDFSYDKLDLTKKQTDQSQEFLQDQIANDITKKYNAIILMQMEINKLKTNSEIKTKDFNTLKTKVSIGLATSNQLTDKQIEINTLKDNITAKENSLKNKVDYLGVLSNLNLSNYTLDSTINYNLLKIDGSIDEYLNNRIDQYLMYNDKLIKLTDEYFHEAKDEDMDKLDYYVNKVVKPNQADYMPTIGTDGNSVTHTTDYALAYVSYIQQYLGAFNNYQSYLEGRYSIAEAKVKLNDSKKNLKNGLNEIYSTLLDLENQINRLNEQIKSTNTKLKDAKTKMDIGMMTENDYKTQVLKSEDLDTLLRNLINTYNTLKNSIEKPWVLTSN
ncbi:MAG TPA: hypothetical protein VF839_09020 [Clostridium sp.]